MFIFKTELKLLPLIPHGSFKGVSIHARMRKQIFIAHLAAQDTQAFEGDYYLCGKCFSRLLCFTLQTCPEYQEFMLTLIVFPVV